MNLVSIKINDLNLLSFPKNGQTWQRIYISLNSISIIWKLLWCVKYATERKGTYSCLDTRLVLVDRW